jgi:hypothetical protein
LPAIVLLAFGVAGYLYIDGREDRLMKRACREFDEKWKKIEREKIDASVSNRPRNHTSRPGSKVILLSDYRRTSLPKTKRH